MTGTGKGDGELVGVVPAAGQGTRLGELPCSKEIFPVGFWRDPETGERRPKAAAHYLLEKMAKAGAGRAYVVLREGKWDIPAHFGDGHFLGIDLAYAMMRRPYGVPFTLDDAYPFLRDAVVLLGFPDILFQPDDVFVLLLDRHRATGADLVLAVYRSRRPDKDDVLELDADGRVRRYEVKPGVTSLTHTWVSAVWGPAFTEFLHEFVAEVEPAIEAAGGLWQGRELYIGEVVWAAVQRGMHVESVMFEDDSYIDIGTPDELAAAVQRYGQHEAEPADAAEESIREARS